MSLARLILDALGYHRRTNFAVALAVMAAGAVLTGALVVGDSMRASLRHLLLDQLGNIDEVLVTDQFFADKLVTSLQDQSRFKEFFTEAVGAIYVQGTIENPRAPDTHPDAAMRAGRVTVIGCDEHFWALGQGGPTMSPAKGEIVLNEPLAAEIGAREGDEVLLRIGSVSQIPPDSALGRKTETVRNRRLKVSQVIAAEGLGRFALRPNQQFAHDAFVALSTLQESLEQPDKINAIFVAGQPGVDPSEAAHDALQNSLQPTLADYGLSIELHKLGYAQCTSNRMLVAPAAVAAIHKSFATDRPQDLFTYLANSIAGGGHQIPYSTITAIDFVSLPPLGPFTATNGQAIKALADDEIVLNSWAADDLAVAPGARIEVTYFEPESTHGQVRESTAHFRLAAIAALEGLAADPDLTPRLPGVTDRLSIGDWDAPFPFDAARVRNIDERYWNEYRTTPKAFISLAAGRRLWSSRFGNTTAVRLAPPEGATVATLSNQLQLDAAAMGFKFLPLKRMGLAAAAGTTSFDGLFIGFSFFIMISSLLLVAILFRLGVDERVRQIGIQRAVGLSNRKVAAVLAGEALLVSALGSLAGLVAGIGYAGLMIRGLNTWWLGATVTPFLALHVTPRGMAIGFASTIIVSMLTIVLVLRRLGRLSVRQLLSGQLMEDRPPAPATTRRIKISIGTMLVVAILTALAAPALGGEEQAGAFVLSGALVLAAGLAWIWSRLRTGATAALSGAGSMPLARLAMRSGARNPTRSTLTIGLIAAASFLIVALSAFRLDPAGENQGRASATGGFDLVAQSDQPIYQDLNTPSGRADLGFSIEDDKVIGKCSVIPFRVRSGDDASCLNLYQPTQPRLLGVSPSLIARGGFAWASTSAGTAEEQENPWLLLDTGAVTSGAVPAVLDYNTATFSLHKKLGEAIEIQDEHGQMIELEIVGLLRNSIFQGDILVGERALLEHFPSVNGYRFFLINRDDQPAAKVRQIVESALGDYGFDAESTTERLAGFFAVQNTYLSTFQSLGGLGLLLGTFALASVQLRSVLNRRGELAVMRATGFRRSALARMVMIENALLLLMGLAVGVVAALVAVVPHWLSGGASVPWLSLILTLALVLVVGLLAGLLAVRATLRAPLLPALRQE